MSQFALADRTRLALPRFILIKSGDGDGSLKYSGKHALYGSPPRWHLITPHKPAPKGAPISAHPKAAGHHEPASHFTPEQWAALKLPASNVNAPSHNSALEKLKAHSDAGEVTGIVGAGYGINTYGVKLSKVANTLLSMHGSPHIVTPGQKAGTHAAVQSAPSGLPAHLAAIAPKLQAVMDAKAVVTDVTPAGYGPVGAKPTITHDSQEAKAPLSGVSVDDAAISSVATEAAAKMAAAGFKPLIHENGKVYIGSSLHDAPKIWPNKDKAVLAIAKLKDAGVNASISGAFVVVDDPLPAVSSVTLPEIEVSAGDSSSKNMEIGGVSFIAVKKQNPNSKNQSYWIPSVAGTGQEIDHQHYLSIKDMWFDLGKLAKMKGDKFEWSLGVKAADSIPAPATPSATNVLHVIPASDGGYEVHVGTPKSAPGTKFSVVIKDESGEFLPTVKIFTTEGAALEHAHALAEGKKPATSPKEGDTKPGANGDTLVLKDGHWVTQLTPFAAGAAAFHAGKPCAPALDADFIKEHADKPAFSMKMGLWQKGWMEANLAAAMPASKLDLIPWGKQLLPESNTNAKSHNAQVEKIKALAEAGDIAGLQAIADAKADAKQTYAKKQGVLAGLAIAALKESGPAAAAAVPAPAAGVTVVSTHFEPAPFGGGHTVVQFSNGKTASLQKLNSAESMGLPGWHDMNAPDGKSSYLADTKDEAIKLLLSKPVLAPAIPSEVTPLDELHALALKAGIKATQSKTYGLVLANTTSGYPKTYANLTQAENAVDKLTALGFDAHATGKHPHLVVITAKSAEMVHALPAPGTGPQDGDTKPGSDGATLVFKDGRWHKQATGLDAVQIPDFNALSPGKYGTGYALVAQSLLDAVKENGAAGLKGIITNHADGRFSIKTSGWHLKKIGPTGPGNPQQKARQSAMHKFVTELKAAAGKPAKVKKVTAPVVEPVADTHPSMDAWTQTGPQAGSNPGGKFKDESGQDWYCKFPADADTAKSEVLAARLYAIAGLAGQDAQLVTKAGKVGIASKWVDVKKVGTVAKLAAVDGAQAGFAVDAWLANWDVIGLGYDNLQVGPDGKAIRIDAGGSLEYRAQGDKKPFGSLVDEIDTMRDAGKNPQAAAVFGKMTKADITASVKKVADISDAQIRATVAEFGPGDMAAKKALAETLIARKADLLARYPKASLPTAKKALDPSALPVNIASIPKPHDFENWNGPGKGLSSKDHVNKANAADESLMFSLAQAGNLTALKGHQFAEIDKETGQPTGKMLRIAQHPSKYVSQYQSDLMQILDEVANPPEPLKVFRETDVGTTHAIEAAFPPKPFGLTVAKVASNEKMGFWVVLGAVKGAQKFAPKAVSHYSSAAITAAKAKFHGASALAKHFIKSVQSSGSYNDLFREGKTADGSGNLLSDVAKAALQHATEMPEGTTLYRWQKISPQMLEHINAAKDGTVFQATGPMCTSYDANATKNFGAHRVVIRYAKGAKAVESFGSGGFSGEKEVTTLPNARFVILSKKMVPDVEHGNPSGQRLEMEVLMLPPDLGIK